MPRPKKLPNSLVKKASSKGSSSKQEDLLDELELFQEWKRAILPELRELLIKGKTAHDISKMFESYAAARAVTIAITEPDSSKALTAIKDIQDRASGKPTETKKIQHEFNDMSEEALDAILLSEEEGLSELSNGEDGNEETTEDPIQ